MHDSTELYTLYGYSFNFFFTLSFIGIKIFFSKSRFIGVTSSNSSSLIKEIIYSNVILTGGTKVTALSEPDALTLVSCFPFKTLFQDHFLYYVHQLPFGVYFGLRFGCT